MSEINLEAVYKENRNMVEGRVCSLLGERTQNVDDIVSEIFLDFTRFVKSGKFKGNSSPQTLLFTIADRRTTDYIRRAVREREGFLKIATDIAVKIQSKPEPVIYDFEWRSLFTKIIDALEVLTELEREVFWFHGVAEVTVSDVAERLGISESSVGHIYSEAKKKLAIAIKDAVREQASFLTAKEKINWLDKFYYAYLRLGEKSGFLTNGVKLAAAQAHKAIKDGFNTNGGTPGKK